MLRSALVVFALMPAQAQQPGALPCDLIRSAMQRQSAQEALAKKQYDVAAKDLQAALDACPSRHSLLLDLVQVNMSRKGFDQAIEAAKRFLELEPGSVAGKVALANAYFMAQRVDEALREAEGVLKTDPAEATALKLKGNIQYLTGHAEDATDTFVLLLQKHPEDEEGAYMLGRIYYQEGRVEHAVGQFERVLKINPNSYKAYDNLGLCYQSLGDNEKAIRYFLTAIKLTEKDHPEYDWAYANLASLLIDKGDVERAFGAASKAADRNPYSARNFYLGGKALWRLGKIDLSLNWLQRSVSLDSTYAEPLYLMARIYSEIGQDDKAKAALEKFRAIKSKEPRQRK